MKDRSTTRASYTKSLLITLLVISLAIGGIVVTGGYAKAATCYPGSCVASYSWPSGANTGGPVHGMQTTMSIVALGCAPSLCAQNSNYFIFNDMWLEDNTTSGCYGLCWIEAGYKTVNPTDTSTTMWYWWADQRPNSAFYAHPIAQVTSSQIGHTVLVNINFIGNGQWQVITQTPAGSYYNYSVDNNMKGENMRIGQELKGIGGWSSPFTTFTGNWWEGWNNYWYYQTDWSNSGIRLDNPPDGGWAIYPAPGGTGGDWYTYCC